MYQRLTMPDPALATFNRLFGPEFGHGKPFDVPRLERALGQLGSPHANLPPVVHVAGTNGKGSTIAFMRVIAQAAGLRVHCFRKPHLFELMERFMFADETVRMERAVVEAAERVAAVDSGLTQFDAQVAVALLLFSEMPADLVVLETGMGGRNDSTNVVEHPVASVITPIGLDHQDVLGSSLAEIAAHKAGILKRGAPAVIARQADEAREVIEAEAERIGAPLFRCGVEWDAHYQPPKLVFQSNDRLMEFWPPGEVAGPHQFDNAGLAVAGLLAAGLLPEDIAGKVEQSMSLVWVHLLGRLRVLRHRRTDKIMSRGGEVWVDVGHNAHAAAAITRALKEMQKRRVAPTTAIIGLRARKDAEGFVGALAGAVDHIIAVPLSEAHVSPHQLVKIAEKNGVQARAARSLDEAIQRAARFPEPRILICGSFLVVAEAYAVDETPR